jgi:hypothetical protein
MLQVQHVLLRGTIENDGCDRMGIQEWKRGQKSEVGVRKELGLQDEDRFGEVWISAPE